MEVTQDNLGELGPIHYGRKRIQPSRQELSQFFRKAEPLLKFERLWFDHAKRQAIGEAFAQVIANRHAVWACAICKNHAHLCIRAHRDPAEIMWSYLTDAGRKAIRTFADGIRTTRFGLAHRIRCFATRLTTSTIGSNTSTAIR